MELPVDRPWYRETMSSKAETVCISWMENLLLFGGCGIQAP